MTTPRQTEYLPLDDLRPDPANPKNHALERIDASISKFGVIDTIAVDGRTGYIISGHGRLEAVRTMRDRGDSAPEGILVDEDGNWLVPVGTGWASRTDAEARSALITLNKTTELGGWVDEALLEVLESIEDEDLLALAFPEGELVALQEKMATLAEQNDEDTFLDDITEGIEEQPNFSKSEDETGMVNLQFAVSPTTRKQVMTSLRATQKEQGLSDLTSALLARLGLQIDG